MTSLSSSVSISAVAAIRAEMDRIYRAIMEFPFDSRSKGSSTATGYAFDTRGHKLFRRSLPRRRLNDFGIYYKSRLSFIRRYSRSFRSNYIDFHDNVHNDVLPVNADIVDFAPRFQEGGSQVKVFDFTGRQVLCMPGATDQQWLAQNELAAYASFQDHPLIPRLVKTLGDGIYVRDIVDGRILTTSTAGWPQVVADCLANLATLYHRSHIRNLTIDEYLANILSQVSTGGTIDGDLPSAIDGLRQIANKRHAGICTLARVHGDFASKNIIMRPSVPPTLIDWERHCERSVTYDLCNFIFKLDHWNDIALPEFFSGAQSSLLSDWRRAVIEKFDASYPDGSFTGVYALFLLERLDLEVRIHGSLGDRRARNFIRFWQPHVHAFLKIAH